MNCVYCRKPLRKRTGKLYQSDEYLDYFCTQRHAALFAVMVVKMDKKTVREATE